MIGIIGGTGLYQLEGLSNMESRKIKTPFGEPSAPVLVGKLSTGDLSVNVAFLPRHGVHHEFLPSEINYRANIWALKAIGVRQILSFSAVGSLTENIQPGELAIPDQYFDFTKGRRVSSFFGDGLVAHISTAEPSCSLFSDHVAQKANEQGIPVHRKKTYACVEGPRLGTRAESFFLQKAGCDLVGMTNIPEAFLAREAQLCYCTIAVVTDYDCWLDDPSQHVSVDKVIDHYKANLNRVKKILHSVLVSDLQDMVCACSHALEGAIMTPEDTLSPDKKRILEFLMG
ncbi:MAG: S-methyl-5'-thioadenosine phosphorylase [Bdellovibrionota bacterium]